MLWGQNSNQQNFQRPPYNPYSNQHGMFNNRMPDNNQMGMFNNRMPNNNQMGMNNNRMPNNNQMGMNSNRMPNNNGYFGNMFGGNQNSPMQNQFQNGQQQGLMNQNGMQRQNMENMSQIPNMQNMPNMHNIMNQGTATPATNNHQQPAQPQQAPAQFPTMNQIPPDISVEPFVPTGQQLPALANNTQTDANNIATPIQQPPLNISMPSMQPVLPQNINIPFPQPGSTEGISLPGFGGAATFPPLVDGFQQPSAKSPMQTETQEEIGKYAQNEKNGSQFYRNLSEISGTDYVRETLSEMSKDSESRCGDCKEIYKRLSGNDFETKNKNIVKEISLRDGIRLAIMEETNSLKNFIKIRQNSILDNTSKEKAGDLIFDKIYQLQLLNNMYTDAR